MSKGFDCKPWPSKNLAQTPVTVSGVTAQENYQGALDVLLLAEEAFDMCRPAHLEQVDNVGLLMIDIVW